MICRRCLQRLAKPSHFTQLSRRTISSTSNNAAEAISTKTIEQAKPRQQSGQPAAISSAAQPFTTPGRIDPKTTNRGQKAASPSTAVVSSVPAGTQLKGLNFLKNKNDPTAMEDGDYPPWLWDVLTPRAKDGEDAAAGDLFSKSKVKRQAAKKALKKGSGRTGEEMFEKVPLHEQAIDLYAGDGSLEGALDAARGRDNLTKAMREKRRADIKESNFLRTMR